MHPGAPSRLPSSYPLRLALGFAHPGDPLGAWVRGARWPLHLRAGGRVLLAATDLGYLLRRCARVLLRVEHHAEVLPAERVIAWRTLQVVIGAPYLPRTQSLATMLPDAVLGRNRLSIPIGLAAPEPTLAACLAAHVPVTASWIEYRVGCSG
jgi:hypothetical protein